MLYIKLILMHVKIISTFSMFLIFSIYSKSWYHIDCQSIWIRSVYM